MEKTAEEQDAEEKAKGRVTSDKGQKDRKKGVKFRAAAAAAVPQAAAKAKGDFL